MGSSSSKPAPEPVSKDLSLLVSKEAPCGEETAAFFKCLFENRDNIAPCREAYLAMEGCAVANPNRKGIFGAPPEAEDKDDDGDDGKREKSAIARKLEEAVPRIFTEEGGPKNKTWLAKGLEKVAPKIFNDGSGDDDKE